MKIRLPFVVLAAALAAAPGVSANHGLERTGPNPDAPAEVAQWGKLEGNWNVEFEFKRDDGSVVTGQAEWNFFYVIDGYAVQDVWINPPRDDASASSARVFGTNLRIYNPERGLWEIVWANGRSKKLEHYEARSNEEEVVMWPTDDPNRARIKFYNMTDTAFDWQEEVSDDDGQTWRVTQTIRGVRP